MYSNCTVTEKNYRRLGSHSFASFNGKLAAIHVYFILSSRNTDKQSVSSITSKHSNNQIVTLTSHYMRNINSHFWHFTRHAVHVEVDSNVGLFISASSVQKVRSKYDDTPRRDSHLKLTNTDKVIKSSDV